MDATCALCPATISPDDMLPWVPLCGPCWTAQGKPLFWPDDIAAENQAVCESLTDAAAGLDRILANRTRCTCHGRGICITCVLDELDREHAVRAA